MTVLDLVQRKSERERESVLLHFPPQPLHVPPLEPRTKYCSFVPEIAPWYSFSTFVPDIVAILIRTCGNNLPVLCLLCKDMILNFVVLQHKKCRQYQYGALHVANYRSYLILNTPTVYFSVLIYVLASNGVPGYLPLLYLKNCLCTRNSYGTPTTGQIDRSISSPLLLRFELKLGCKIFSCPTAHQTH